MESRNVAALAPTRPRIAESLNKAQEHPRGELIISTAAVALVRADKTNERRGAC